MSIESAADLEGLQRAGRTVAAVLQAMAAAIRPRITTSELDTVARDVLYQHGAQAAPRVTYGFPGYSCISVNDEIVHGVPGTRRLQLGDVVKLDVTAEQDGYIADAARTVFVGTPVAVAARLQQSAAAALAAALDVARPGVRVSAIGRAVEAQARQDGFAVIRELCGHGVGRAIHEAPQVPNYENRFSHDVLREGMVIAIEPMLAVRRARAVQMADGWTIRTSNGALAAHEEHTVVIRREGPLVLTYASASM